MNCGSERARATKTLCQTCYVFKRRTGQHRGEAAIVAENIKRFEDEVERKLVREAVLRAERAEERRLRQQGR